MTLTFNRIVIISLVSEKCKSRKRKKCQRQTRIFSFSCCTYV